MGLEDVPNFCISNYGASYALPFVYAHDINVVPWKTLIGHRCEVVWIAQSKAGLKSAHARMVGKHWCDVSYSET